MLNILNKLLCNHILVSCSIILNKALLQIIELLKIWFHKASGHCLSLQTGSVLFVGLCVVWVRMEKEGHFLVE